MFDPRKSIPRQLTEGHRSAEPIEAPDLKDSKLTKLNLSNGLTCYVALGPSMPRYFGASVFTPALWGMGEAHILEHGIMSGSARYPSPNIYAELHTTSDSQPGAYTYYNRTWFTGSAFSEQGLERVSDYILDSIYHPLLSFESFKTESFKPIREFTGHRSSIAYPAGVVYNEMRQSYMHPDNVALRNAVAHLFPEALPQMDFAGSPEGIKKLSRSHDKILKYHDRFYYPENSVFLVSHPRSPDPILKMLEQLPRSGRSHNYEPPSFDISQRPRQVHITHPVHGEITGHSSNMVILIPIERPTSLKQVLFYNLIWDTLFFLDRNRYSDKITKDPFEGRCALSSCQPITLGAQTFFAIQVDRMAPGDHEAVRDRILNTYRTITERNLPFSTFKSALGGLRHYFTSTSNNIDDVFWSLTADKDTLPHLNSLTRGAVAHELHNKAREIYPEFCRFAEKLLARNHCVFSQDSIPTKSRARASSAPLTPEHYPSPPTPWQVQVQDYPLMTKRIVKSAGADFIVENPFEGDLQDAIIRTPIGDENRVHLNIGFDLSALRADLWMHAIFLLNTLTENRSNFRSHSHVSVKLNGLSSPATNIVYPINRDGCTFVVGVSIVPNEVKSFLRMLHKVFKQPDYSKNAYLHGLEYQRDSLFPDIFDPSASDELGDAFMTRALSYYDRGYRLREALVGFEALPKFNKILTAWNRDNFEESEDRMFTAINYLFSGSAIHIQYSAPKAHDSEVAKHIGDFYRKQRRWDKNVLYYPTRKLARNDLLVAPSVTNIAARVFHMPEFRADLEPALAYIKGFVISKELNNGRGFYRNYVKFDSTTSCLVLMAQRGSSASAPFRVYDRIPEILDGVELTPRQLKGLQTGALMSHLDRISDSDPHAKMLRRVRLARLGLNRESFQEYANSILDSSPSSLKELAELLNNKRSSCRNLILTGKEGEREVAENLKHIRFGKPLACHL